VAQRMGTTQSVIARLEGGRSNHAGKVRKGYGDAFAS
jgi:predicted transcriptional regulator